MSPPRFPVVYAITLAITSACAGAKHRVILMAGQSNMTGLGRLDCSASSQQNFASCLNAPGSLVTPQQLAEMSIVRPQIQIAAAILHTLIPRFAPLALPVRPDPNQAWSNLGASFGPEFGLGIWSHLGKTATLADPLYLVKYHAPGTAMCPASTNTWESDLGTEMRTAFRTAIGSLGGLSNVEILGLLWIQGESDIYSPCSDTYASHFLEFIRISWGEFGTFPVIVARVGGVNDMWAQPGRALVRSEQARLPSYSDLIRTFDAGDLDVHADDRAHYNTQSQITLGIRFADCLEDKSKCDPSPRTRHRKLELWN